MTTSVTLTLGADTYPAVLPPADSFVIFALDGNDSVDLSGAPAVFLNNSVLGGTGDDTLVGTSNSDWLFGEGDNDSLSGGGDNDNIEGGAGADTLDGGAGTADILSYRESFGDVTVDLGNAIATGGDASGDSVNFASFEYAWGGHGNDTLIGNSGDGLLWGWDGNDSLTGLDGLDTLVGDVGADTLIGGNGADYLIGGAASDSLIAGAGDDNVEGGAGADTLDGGTDNNTLSYFQSTLGVTANLSTASAGGGDADGDSTNFASFNNLWGSNVGADLLTGDGNGNSIDGFGGSDTLVGLGGGDYLLGDLGDDSVDGGDGDDSLYGQEGNDTLLGGNDQDALRGLQDDDSMLGGGGNDTIAGDLGADTLNGGAGDDTADYSALQANGVFPTNGITVNLATNANSGLTAAGDSLTGIETVIGTYGGDRLTGTGANERFVGEGLDTLIGGNDTLDGGAGDDTLSGWLGDDSFVGGAGADSMNGDSGYNTVDYSASGAAITLELQTGAASGGDATGDTVLNMQSVIATGFADRINNYTSSIVNSSVRGGLGDDTMTSGSGADTLDGEGGFDAASYVNSLAVTVDLGNNANNSGGFAAGDSLVSIEYLVGSQFEDSLTGDGLDNTIQGMAGADTIAGGGGNDTARYAVSPTGVTVDLSNNANNDGGHAEGDVLSGIETLGGSAFADLLIGNGGANRLNGGAGADTLIGGVGADTLDGGADNDTVTYAASSGAVTVTLTSNTGGGTGSGGDAAGDVLINIQHLIGSAQGDVLTGHAQVNHLTGGAGNDTLTGGSNADVFIFAAGQGADRIMDFGHLVDKVQIANGTNGIMTAAQAYAAVTDVGGVATLNLGGGNTVTFVGLTTANLSASDFLIV